MSQRRQTEELGTLPIEKLLVKQSVPATIGIMVVAIYMIVDSIFVGKFVSSLGIGAITVITPITFLISAMGMGIGVGGASVVSRALGAQNYDKAKLTFGNMIVMTVSLSLIVLLIGIIFDDEILWLFGAEEDVFTLSKEYFSVIVIGIPALAIAMMFNNIIRAEGYPNYSMIVMLIPAIINIALDPIFIIVFDMGMAGAAWATVISYYGCLFYCIRFFFTGKSQLAISKKHLNLNKSIVGQISSLGSVTLARQGAISVLSIVLNNSLTHYGGQMYLSIYGVIGRVMMFVLSPIIGITQGILPIVGYNYGAEKLSRVRETVRKAISYGTLISIGIYVLIYLLRYPIVGLFTDDTEVISKTPGAMVIVFLATPFVAAQMIGAAYFQGIGKAIPAVLLTLLRQAIVLVPMVLILSYFFQVDGIWYAFPFADLISFTITIIAVSLALRKLKPATKAL